MNGNSGVQRVEQKSSCLMKVVVLMVFGVGTVFGYCLCSPSRIFRLSGVLAVPALFVDNIVFGKDENLFRSERRPFKNDSEVAKCLDAILDAGVAEERISAQEFLVKFSLVDRAEVGNPLENKFRDISDDRANIMVEFGEDVVDRYSPVFVSMEACLDNDKISKVFLRYSLSGANWEF